MKRVAILIMIAGLTLWSCATAPDETEKPLESDPEIESSEDTVVEQADEVSPELEGVQEPEAAEVSVETVPDPVFRLDRVVSYLSNGVLDTVTHKVYKDGLLVEELETYADGSPAGKIAYAYKNELLVSSLKTDRAGTVLSSFSYKYDSAGNLAEETLLDASGNPIFTYRFSYDSENRRERLEIVSGSGTLLSYAEYMYANGKNHRVETFSLLGELQEYLERSFNGSGLPVSEIISSVDGKELEKVVYEYSGGVLVEKEMFVNSRKIGSTRYGYDKAGNISLRKRYDRTGKLIETIEYVYKEVEA